jgi:phosphatidylglycerol:prolipoprotein diacylglycerol transferase
MLIYPHISPIALQIGPFAIRWYALAYLAGVVGGWFLVGKLNNKKSPPVLSAQAYDDIMVWAVLGIILGGRIGYVLFYKPDYYLDYPLEALMVWHGGMSFHGGLLGMITAMFLFGRKHKIRFFDLMDLLAVAAPIGLCLGRLANFVNGELYGRVTDSPLGMIFPGSDGLPRHPSQLYEAGLEGILLFIILLFIAVRTNALQKTGLLSGLFLIGYALARMTAELFREPDSFIHFLPDYITMGQLLSIPMLLFGAYLVYAAQRSDH